MKIIKNFIALICAFGAHLANFVTDPATFNFTMEKENYNSIMKHAGLENFGAEDFDDFEYLENYDDSFESLEDLDTGTRSMFKDFENFRDDFVRRGNNRRIATNMAHQRMRAKSGNNWLNAIKTKKSNTLVGGKGSGQTIAEFKLIVNRWGNNINVDLPCVLFAPIHKLNNYSRALKDQNPNVRIVSVSDDTVNGNVIITYQATGGGATDSLIISCEETAYTTLLNALLTDVFVIAKTRIQVDLNDTDQFSRNWALTKYNCFGKGTSNTINIENKKSPMQFQSNILDVMNPMHIDKETALVFGVKRNLLVTKGITLSMSVSSFYRHDRNAVRV